MPRISNKSSTGIDKSIGRNVRIYRLSKGVTQHQLGAKLGVTFQQIQKYENGTSRISSGRLFQIAQIFEVPVTDLFIGEKVSPASHPSPFDLLNDPMSLQILMAFAKISNKIIRRAVMDLLESMSKEGKR
ncbi:MAG: helix-turn-helix transcriptional regulator [Xanthobacteraceae bacterium]|jgi:transcriptional regulator with XRE-family HTH domain